VAPVWGSIFYRHASLGATKVGFRLPKRIEILFQSRLKQQELEGSLDKKEMRIIFVL
jgi:hypothetical protein